VAGDATSGLGTDFTSNSVTPVDGVGTNAIIQLPQGLCSDTSGNIYVTERFACSVRRIDSSGVVTTIAGLGTCSGNAPVAYATATPALSADLGGIAHIQPNGAGGFFIGEASA
jgi:hypothetical protein